MKLKCPWFLWMVLELVFLITVPAAGYPLISVSCRSLLIAVNSKVYQSLDGSQSSFQVCIWIEVCHEWRMWHCHVERSLNVTLGPGSQMAGRKSMMQTQCGAWRVEMDLGQHRVMQAVNNQSIISFKGKWSETWWKYCERAYSGEPLACKCFDLHL